MTNRIEYFAKCVLTSASAVRSATPTYTLYILAKAVPHLVAQLLHTIMPAMFRQCAARCRRSLCRTYLVSSTARVFHSAAPHTEQFIEKHRTLLALFYTIYATMFFLFVFLFIECGRKAHASDHVHDCELSPL